MCLSLLPRLGQRVHLEGLSDLAKRPTLQQALCLQTHILESKASLPKNGLTLSLQQLQKKRQALCPSASARAWGGALQAQRGHRSRVSRLQAIGTAGRKQAQYHIRSRRLYVNVLRNNLISISSFTITTVDPSALWLSDPIALPLVARTEAELLGHSPRSTEELKSVHVPCS